MGSKEIKLSHIELAAKDKDAFLKVPLFGRVKNLREI